MTSTILRKLCESIKSIKDILECPVCYLTPKKSGKIEVCINGHYICESCRPRVTICPLCRTDKLNFSSPLLDRLLKSLPIICSKASFGCQDTFEDEHNLEVHEPICSFRIVNCLQLVCKGKKILFKDLPNHLKEIHGTINAVGDVVDDVSIVITDDDLQQNNQQDKYWLSSHELSYGPSWALTSARTFFATYHVKHGILEIECIIWGSASLAREYICKISIKGQMDSNYAFELSGDVLSIDDFKNEEQKNGDRPGYFVLTGGMIKQLRHPQNKNLLIEFEFKKREVKNSPQNLSVLNDLTDFDPITRASGRLSPLDLSDLSPITRVTGRQSPLDLNLSPIRGNLSPLRGNLSPIRGNLSPISSFSSLDLSPVTGRLRNLDFSEDESGISDDELEQHTNM